MTDFIDQLRGALTRPLPGKKSQQEMLARRSNGQQFPFRHMGAPKEGGVAVVLYPHQNRWFIPLMKRPNYSGIHSGQISFPGGKKEPEDEDLIQTAIRETQEEIGVKLHREHILGKLSPLYISASHYQVHPVVIWCPQRPEFEIDPREVAALVEVTLDDLKNPKFKKAKEIVIRGTEIWAPYFDLQQEFVWGATAMMLNEFFDGN